MNHYLKTTFGLTGRRVLLVGGRGNIGTGMAHSLLKAGAELWITSRSREKAAQSARDLSREFGKQVHALTVDVFRPDSIREACLELVDQGIDALDGLIVNAGGNVEEAVIPPSKSFFCTNPAPVEKVVHLNYSGPREAIRVFGKLLLKGSSPVITVTSSVAPFGLSRVFDYGAAKAGLDTLVQGLAIHLARHEEVPVRINGVRVGFAFSNSTESQNSFAVKDPVRMKCIMSHIPMGRSATPEEVGDCVVFLQSAAARYITGSMLTVDGGFLCDRLGEPPPRESGDRSTAE